ncbi:hypothetical protein NA56DRAFT_700437 [Hyaloscypha hepaticicola]|uniref:Uncharacterized protein n=1 Tax=Hyaloscypha hepaticicola TaxID=2082293 RepID=A0A2J6QCI7_9HELO|nr:hypothetical protein NA56DRAFT_700437 [Hyaloscypha hepaticicola]
MSRNVFDSSAVSVCFSAALDDEIHEIEKLSPVEERRPPQLNGGFAAALALEIEGEYKHVAMMKEDLEDKCLRFAATLSDEEDIKASDLRIPLPVREHTDVPKKVQRSRYKTVRPYSWKQPFKNKARLRSKGLQPPKRTNKKASSNTEPDLSKHGETTPSLKRKRTVLSDEDEFDVDDLFEETDEGEIMVDVDTEGRVKETRAASRATTRQLAMMVRKNMKELYKLADINLSKPESLCVEQNTLRQVVDKVKNREAADLSSEEIVTLHQAIDHIEDSQLAMGP